MPPDTGAVEGGPGDTGPTIDAAPSSPCARFPDGTRCTIDGIAEDLVCRGGFCELSQCGDGLVDDRSEQCDDGNDVSGDGCEPRTCIPSCTAASECDNGLICDGAEGCSDDRCVAGTMPPDGTGCVIDVNRSGSCRMGVCVSAGCGNGIVEAPEECDRGPTGSADCQPDCTWTCETDAECSARDMNVCDGIDICEVTSHLCVVGIISMCVPDNDECTIESCDPVMGCVLDRTSNDKDGDGHFAVSCGGDDCDDNDGEVYPGHSETCDGIDNDCNEIVDDGSPVWYADCDSDGFASTGAQEVRGCDRPLDPPGLCRFGAGQWISRAPLSPSNTDCADDNASARPGQTAFFDRGYSSAAGTSFDYDCDGRTTPQYPTTGSSACAGLGTCSGDVYYAVGTRVTCGASAQLSFCGRGSLVLNCERMSSSTSVACR